MSLSTIELRRSVTQKHAAKAKENAKLALMLAIGELQRYAGSDQVATAPAAILESSPNAMSNRNWLGVWKTTQSLNNREWHVIGKAPSAGTPNDSPYSQAGVYEDLRHTQGALNGGKWKNALRIAWLVSRRSESIDPAVKLDPNEPGVIELLGRGALGNQMPADDFSKNQILVEKVNVGTMGAYAWHVSDESQKASVMPITDDRDDGMVFEAAARANPGLVMNNAALPFQNFNKTTEPETARLITHGSVNLALKTQQERQSFGEMWNHFTMDSKGLFTNPVSGGLKRDLTPLLLGKKDSPSLDLSLDIGVLNRKFSSAMPIIPGQEHGVLGPSFDALRNWAQHAHTNLNQAETSFTNSAVRERPTTSWTHGISDGAAADATHWAKGAPKIHPVMTDVRWHYYFSHQNRRIRTHIIPRVCLWNPYSRPLKIPDLSVLMPNPFFNITHGMHFFPEENYVNQLKTTSAWPISRWAKSGGYVGGSVYKMRLNPFPQTRYLAFTLEGTTLAAGECQVFSPSVTSPDASASGVNLQLFQENNPAINRLSSKTPQGTDHFYFDHSPSILYQIQATTATGTTVDWRNLTLAQMDQLDLSRIFDYQPEVALDDVGKTEAQPKVVEGFPFILKVGTSASLLSLYTNTSHPTLQLVYFGGGGARSNNYFAYQGSSWGSANQQDNSFGLLDAFSNAPMKDAPATHQVGAKLLWLDESGTEGNAPPLRTNRWTQNHMALNVAPAANWNLRAQLGIRSPAAQAAKRWYMASAGSWFLQFVPYSPQNVNDQPSLNSESRFVKNPFGASVDYSFSPNVALFDLPSNGHGVLSLARLRHAMLSPFSWTPSYIVGHSLRDLHAPSNGTAHAVAASPYSGVAFPTRWDFLLGAAAGGSAHGARAAAADSQGLLQIGNQAVTKSVSSATFSSQDEVLAYDIAYEVNNNLWDGYFFSSIPLSTDTESFSWNLRDPLLNPRYQINPSATLTGDGVQTILNGAKGLENGFYRNAEFLQNTAAFNVNSTSVPAWVSFLSSTLGKPRPLSSGQTTGEEVTFSRYLRPTRIANTAQADPDSWGAWVGGRELADSEIRLLAENIVVEVKKRGPFLSLSDFVNRRLAEAVDETSHQGTLEAAIMASRLNKNFESNPAIRTTAVNQPSNGDVEANDNNQPDFINGYRYRGPDGQFTTTQPQSKAWGLPGFLTQGDILEPLAPALTTRGDTFVIRTYGESRDESGIKARAWIEAVVVRTPPYVEHRSAQVGVGPGNSPLEAASEVDYATGQVLKGSLSDTNKKFGRKFELKSFRWLHPKEI